MGDKHASPQVDKNATILSQLEKHAEQSPDRPAYIFVDKDLGHRIITRQELWDMTRKIAAFLKRRGIGKGDVVCNTLVNSPERLLSYFGTLASGATPTHGQLFLADGSDLIHNLKESKATAIIYDPRIEDGAKRIIDGIKFTDEATGMSRYKDLPHLKQVIEIEAKGLEEAQRWMHVMNKEEDMFVDESVSKDDIGMVYTTSGTTGFSKLVPYPHTSLLKVIRGLKGVDGFNKDTVVFNMQSLGWLGGYVRYYPTLGCIRILVDFTNGLRTDMNMGTFLVRAFNQNAVTTAVLNARDIHHVLDAYDEGVKVDKMFEALFTAGSPVHPGTMDALGKLTHKVIVAYGGTEFLLVAANVISNKSDFQDMCVGNLLNCEVKIVGEENEEVPVGEQGEILMRSGSIFKGYLNNPTKTAHAFTKDGWYRTGDMGYFNKEGQLFVLCRMADVITKDGFCHYPGWMEQLINKHPGIKKSAVIGIPDPVHHEEICLIIKREPGTDVSMDDVREHCKKLFLTGEDDKMTPLPKHYLVFDEFITNANGKDNRKKMREEALRMLNIDQNKSA